MKIIVGTALLFFAMAGPLRLQSQNQPHHHWRPAVYRGLIMGESSLQDLKKVLGEPERSTKAQGTRPLLLSYIVTEPVPGTLEADIENGKIKLLMLTLKHPLSQKESNRIFGTDFQITHYSFDECLNDGGESPVYENPDGDIEQIEYRQRGIALSVYQGRIDIVQYLSGPLGRTHSTCAKSESKNKIKPSALGNPGQTGRFHNFRN